MLESKKMFIMFVQYEKNKPLVVSSELSLDSEYNLYCDLSDKLSDAYTSSDENFYKAVKKSFAFNKDYKVTKYNL